MTLDLVFFAQIYALSPGTLTLEIVFNAFAIMQAGLIRSRARYDSIFRLLTAPAYIWQTIEVDNRAKLAFTRHDPIGVCGQMSVRRMSQIKFANMTSQNPLELSHQHVVSRPATPHSCFLIACAGPGRLRLHLLSDAPL
jgi:hypothetical protein